MLKGQIKLIAISGIARCGKDTLAQALAGQFAYRQYSFAEPIYRMLHALPYLEHLNSNLSTEEKEAEVPFYGKSPRRMLQTLGTEWGRNLISPELWISIMEQKLQNKMDITRHSAFVISDLRFANEAEWVRKQGGLVVRIYRGHSVAVAKHSSEDGFDLLAGDHRAANDGSIEDLCQLAPRINELAEDARRLSVS